MQEMETMDLDLGYLPTLYAILLVEAFYAVLVISLVLYLSIGVWSWVVIGVCVSPVVIALQVAVKKRWIRWYESFKPYTVDTEKCIQEYVHMIKRKVKNS